MSPLPTVVHSSREWKVNVVLSSYHSSDSQAKRDAIRHDNERHGQTARPSTLSSQVTRTVRVLYSRHHAQAISALYLSLCLSLSPNHKSIQPTPSLKNNPSVASFTHHLVLHDLHGSDVICRLRDQAVELGKLLRVPVHDEAVHLHHLRVYILRHSSSTVSGGHNTRRKHTKRHRHSSSSSSSVLTACMQIRGISYLCICTTWPFWGSYHLY